jgi:hypothetical protein
MAEVHQLIIRYGIEEARRQAMTKHERAVVEAAYQVLSDDAERMGFTYSGFALTSLPHKPQESQTWRREGHNITLVLQAGVDRNEKSLGLPYGSYARFILLFLQSEAIRTQLREVELGRSMKVWLGAKMGLSIGGTTYKKGRRTSPPHLRLLPDLLYRSRGRPNQESQWLRQKRNYDDQLCRRSAEPVAGPGDAR